jgi:hypothetical protein
MPLPTSRLSTGSPMPDGSLDTEWAGRSVGTARSAPGETPGWESPVLSYPVGTLTPRVLGAPRGLP